jgi:putative transferase (TIGR04331 family)
VGWYFNEPFKFWAAEASERGSRLVTVQHGSYYGMSRFAPTELHESRAADTFMVWGWADEKIRRSRNLPSPKLSSLGGQNSRKSNSKTAQMILFVGSALERYLFRFHSAPIGGQWQYYLEWEMRFFSALPERLRPVVFFRPLLTPQARVFALRQRVSSQFPEIQWDIERSVYRSIERSRIAVIDHSGTTFLEALVANIPTVLFWDSQFWEFREEAEPYIESLREGGILLETPEAAAAQVAKIYDDPWKWWGSQSVQEIRHRFIDRYAFAREDWENCWVQALEDELRTSRLGLRN